MVREHPASRREGHPGFPLINQLDLLIDVAENSLNPEPPGRAAPQSADCRTQTPAHDLHRRLSMQLKHATLLAALMAAGFAHAQSQPVIGLITKTETNPFFVKMKEGATEAAKAKGAKLLSGAGKADGDNAGQVTAMENMIAAGAKTILITPSDSKAIIPAIKKAQEKGVQVIALDSPTDPAEATDALFATDNYKAGVLIGQYAKAAMGGKPVKIATLDLFPGHPVGAQRHNGFLQGFGLQSFDAKNNELAKPAEVVCMADSFGDRAKGQTAMENCLQKNPDINLVYTINEPAAAGAFNALQKAGKEKGVMIVSVDGGCDGVKDVAAGKIAATSQQYPLKMAAMGVEAGVEYAKNGKKVKAGYTDTGVTLIANKAVAGVDSKDTKLGMDLCWGKK
jgi:fructose transport system substrate-binding protein